MYKLAWINFIQVYYMGHLFKFNSPCWPWYIDCALSIVPTYLVLVFILIKRLSYWSTWWCLHSSCALWNEVSKYCVRLDSAPNLKSSFSISISYYRIYFTSILDECLESAKSNQKWLEKDGRTNLILESRNWFQLMLPDLIADSSQIY